MATQDTTPVTSAQGLAGADKPTESARYLLWAIASLVLTILGWIAGAYNGYVAVGVCAAAIAAACVALRSHRAGVRNTAITSIIASSVLVVVVGAFLIVMYVGVKG